MESSENLRRVKSLLLAVVDLPADQQSKKLDHLCQGDPQLRQDVESLLGFDNDAAQLFRTGCVLPSDRPPDDNSQEPCPTSPAPISKPRLVGQTVSHYRIVELIGQGGMGEIYLAEDLNLDRKVAIKFLTQLRRSDPLSEHRFRTEARAASALDQQNIGVIHEFGQTETGQMYMVLGHHQGGSLRDLAARQTVGILKPDLAIGLMIQVLSGLHAAHQAGIVHRDLKPENIMLSGPQPEQATARIIDFGLAKLADQDGFTRTGSSLGTMAYMSPQQIRGEEINAQTDLFSVGVMLQELLTGSLPFDRETPAAMLLGILEDQPDPLPSDLTHHIPGIATVVSRALAKKTEDRYRSALEMLTDLKKIDDQLLVTKDSQKIIPAGGRLGPGPRRTRALFTLGLLAVASLIALYGLGSLGRNPSVGPHLTALQAISPTLSLYGTGSRVFGSMVNSAGDVNGDGFPDFIIGDGPNNTLSKALVYLYLGGDPLDATADLFFQGEVPQDHFGRQATAVGDVNGDGFDDLLIAAQKFDSSRGRVYLFFGGAVMDNIPDVVFSGDNMTNRFGACLAGACDLNGDGLGDIAIGMPGYSQGVTRAGIVAIYFGRQDHLWPPSLGLAQADLQLSGDRIGQYLGTTLACAGDLNHDGYDAIFLGESRQDRFGACLANLGDVNGDGNPNFLIGAPGFDPDGFPFGSGHGAAYLFAPIPDQLP